MKILQYRPTGLGLGALLALAQWASAVQAEPAVSRGALLASMCVTCHGPDGQGMGDTPKINGKPAAELVKILQAMASGETKTIIMDRHAAGYTADELQAVADYFAGL
jgi:sulfide dehydrogenase cytochrome subunit